MSRMLVFLVVCLLALQGVDAATCNTAGNGPCPCPDPADQCLADSSGAQVCCGPNDVNGGSPPPPPPPPPGPPSAPCVDKLNPSTGVSDCPKNAALCNNSVYYSLMTDQCPKTCNRCGGGGGGSTCVDKLNPSTGVSDCPKNAALCNNSVYYDLMTDQCPKTCNRCSSGK